MISHVQRWFPAHLIAWIVFGIILAFAAYALIVSFDFGLGDNGDFIRISTWFSSGPVGLEGYVAPGEATYWQRYITFWLPYWRLDFPDAPRKFSSIVFLWIPGLALNRLIGPAPVTYLPMLSLVSRLILLALPAFIWIASKKISMPAWKRLLLWIIPGIPYALIIYSGDNLVYLDSLYQEAASYVYILVFLVSAVFAVFRPTPKARLAVLLTATLLALAKPSNFYWMAFGVMLAVPWVELVKGFKPRLLGQVGGLALGAIAVIAVSTYTPADMAHLSDHTKFHSFFNGVLAFSQQPEVHLKKLGYPSQAINCLGQIAFSQKGGRCLAKYRRQVSYLQSAQVILAEPLIPARMWLYASRRMFVTNLRYGRVPEWRDGESLPFILDVWSNVRARLYPSGYNLFLTLCAYYLLFGLGLYRRGPGRAIAFVGLLTALACPIDMLVAMMGDGRTDLLKHLFLANLLFDIATASMLGVVTGRVFDWAVRGKNVLYLRLINYSR